MKYFVFSDVHSYYDQLIDALNEKGFDVENPNHAIVSLGDLLDRGPSPLQCLKFVNMLPKERKILIRGNHEDLLFDCIKHRNISNIDYRNGTAMTLCELGDYGLCTFSFDEMFDHIACDPRLNNYKKCLRNYAEVGDNIFVHGWIPCFSNDGYIHHHARDVKYSFDENWRKGDWGRARWVNGMDAWNNGIMIPGKQIFCGHWHASWGHKYIDGTSTEFDIIGSKESGVEPQKADFSPFIADGICAIDACTHYSGKVNVVTIEE